jgi:hypothetical protein
MMEYFEMTPRWRILARFLEDPNKRLNIQKNYQKGEISYNTAMRSLRPLVSIGMAKVYTRERPDNVFELVKDHPVVHPLRTAYGRIKVLSAQVGEEIGNEIEDIASISLVGGFVNGTFDGDSPVELLGITETESEIPFRTIGRLEERIGRNIVFNRYLVDEWQDLRDKGDPIFKNAQREHIHLFGESLEDP